MTIFILYGSHNILRILVAHNLRSLNLLFLGFKTETPVCAHEETAFLYWWRRSGAAGLSVGQSKLDGPFLVQVCYINKLFFFILGIIMVYDITAIVNVSILCHL